MDISSFYSQLVLKEITLIYPEILLVTMTIVALLIDVFKKDKNTPFAYVLSIISFIATGVLLLNSLGSPKELIFNNSVVIDDLSQILKALALFSSAVLLVYSQSYLKSQKLYKSEYFVLLMFANFGIMVMLSAYSMLSMYIGLEIFSLAVYTLIAFASSRVQSIEAAVKYFVLGALASGILLYGISMIYGISGTIYIGEISNFLSNNLDARQTLIVNFGLIFLVIGIAFKLGAVPFHMWAPDVYEGSPSSVTAFLASTAKLASLAILLRVFVAGFNFSTEYWAQIFMFIAVLSIGFGSIVALMQTNIKRMLAYSAISHVGFILLGFATGLISGYAASIYYVFAYIITNLVAFAVILLLSNSKLDLQEIDDFSGLAKTSPLMALIMLCAMLSLAGVPPFVGFLAKFFILEQLVAAGMVEVAIIAVIFALISAFYYLKIIKVMYFSEVKNPISVSGQKLARGLLSLNALLLVLIVLIPNYWLDLALDLLK